MQVRKQTNKIQFTELTPDHWLLTCDNDDSLADGSKVWTQFDCHLVKKSGTYEIFVVNRMDTREVYAAHSADFKMDEKSFRKIQDISREGFRWVRNKDVVVYHPKHIFVYFKDGVCDLFLTTLDANLQVFTYYKKPPPYKTSVNDLM